MNIMRTIFNWRVVLAVILLLLSAVTYLVHYLIFRDARHIFLYLIGDIAFVFVNVLLVTIIIEQALGRYEKKSNLKKLNMVIETFFSDFGKHVLVYLSNFDRNLDAIHDLIVTKEDCGDINFKAALKAIKKYRADIDMDKLDLFKLSGFLTSNRRTLINLLQNPSLLEHERFTETLMAVFHIAEELAAEDLKNLSAEDKQHTKEDIERAYNLLIDQWLSYMMYIEEHYPYFYVFAMRTNPFDEKASWLEKWYETSAAE